MSDPSEGRLQAPASADRTAAGHARRAHRTRTGFCDFPNSWRDADAADRQLETQKAVRMAINLKEAFAGDAEIGKALVNIIKTFKPSEVRSFELPILAADALSAIKPKGVASDL